MDAGIPIWTYWRSGGLLLIPLALTSIAIWAWFLHLRRHYVAMLRASEGVIHTLVTMDPAREAGQLDARLATVPGVFATRLRALVDEVRNGSREEAAFDRSERMARQAWRRDLIMLAALTSVAPLLGLLGTVAGMIATFDAVATAAGQTTSRIADGISTALITTQFGLIIALPGVFGLARLNRLIRALEVRWAECRSMVQAMGISPHNTGVMP